MRIKTCYYIIRNLINFTRANKLEKLVDEKLKKYNKKVLNIALHGTLQTYASSFYDMFIWFDKRGILIVPIDYPYKIPIKDAALIVKNKVKSLLKKTNSKKVNILAHSYGGLVARYYLQKLGGDKVTNKLITIGTPHNGIKIDNFWNWLIVKVPGGVRDEEMNNNPITTQLNKIDKFKNHVSIVGLADKIALPKYVEYKKAKNIYMKGVGHLAELHNPIVFDVIKKELGAKK